MFSFALSASVFCACVRVCMGVSDYRCEHSVESHFGMMPVFLVLVCLLYFRLLTVCRNLYVCGWLRACMLALLYIWVSACLCVLVFCASFPRSSMSVCLHGCQHLSLIYLLLAVHKRFCLSGEDTTSSLPRPCMSSEKRQTSNLPRAHTERKMQRCSNRPKQA